VQEQRKSKRFELKLPLELVGNGSESEICETRNLSSAGVLFCAPFVVELGQQIEYVITFPSSGQGAYLRIRCVGKVVRQANVAEFAATLDRYKFVRNGG
jgi:hypothetical protein